MHCVKRVHIRSFFWSVMSVRMRENTDQKKLGIWPLFTQWLNYFSFSPFRYHFYTKNWHYYLISWSKGRLLIFLRLHTWYRVFYPYLYSFEYVWEFFTYRSIIQLLHSKPSQILNNVDHIKLTFYLLYRIRFYLLPWRLSLRKTIFHKTMPFPLGL